MNTARVQYLSIGGLVLVFLVSLAAYALAPAKYEKRVFFFRELMSDTEKSISRYIPAGFSLESRISRYVAEMVLGPHLYNFSPVFTADGPVDLVLYRDRTVYIAFGREMAFNDNETALNAETYDLVSRNIFYNFPSVRRIVFTIDGIQVHAVSRTQSKKATEYTQPAG
ncbi:MAG: hypothetical protein JXB03_11050 [Spirochaetales bacterium]|nr:hypothetical protein [Spirochaetales bacterium]